MNNKDIAGIAVLFVKLFLVLLVIAFFIPMFIDTYLRIFLENMIPRQNSVFVYKNLTEAGKNMTTIIFFFKKLILFL